TDYNFQQTARLVARLELPPETANQVYTLQQDMQARLRDLNANRDLPRDDRTTKLAVLGTEAEAKLTSLLGARGYEAYKQNGGYWVQQFQPTTPTPGGQA